MEIAEHVAALDDEGRRLVEAAAQQGADVPVPTCPEWRLRDLLVHVGRVHRWATMFVAQARTEPPHGDAELAEPPADDDALLAWVAEGHHALVETLRAADPAIECWSFLRSPSPLAFWARRQAHETAIHRVDAESAAGDPAGVAAPFAVDGIDELLLGFLARRSGRLLSEEPVTLGVHARDTGDDWWIEIRPDGRSVRRGAADADCAVTGDASDLYLFLWNRRDDDGLGVTGDRRVLGLWRDKARVTWS